MSECFDKKVSLVFCSDVHFSGSVPVARSCESDWFEAQARIIRQVKRIAVDNYCPLLIAGDLFDRWNSGSECVNRFLLEFEDFPAILAVPGQHDLPLHNYEDIHKSSYYTLVLSRVIVDIPAGRCRTVGRINVGGEKIAINVWGFPYGTSLAPPESSKSSFNIALIHSYVWDGSKGYKDPPKDRHYKRFFKGVEGYDLFVVGDNHRHFVQTMGGATIFNCGRLIPRSVDNRDPPVVGVLHEDGSVGSVVLDVEGDKWVVEGSDLGASGIEERMKKYVEGMRETEVGLFDFEEELKRFVENRENGVSAGARKVLSSVLEV